MKRTHATAVLTSLVLLFSTGILHAAGDTTHRQQVETLFRLTQMEKKINESVENVLQLQMRQNPQMAQHEKELRAFFTRHIGWSALKDDIAQMYMQKFTREELDKINDFYITPAGQKVINVLPELVQQRNQLAMQRLQQNIGELQNILGSSKGGHPAPR